MNSDKYDAQGIEIEKSELTLLVERLGLTQHDNLLLFGNHSKVFLFSFNELENIATLLDFLTNNEINWKNKRHGVIISLTGESHSINENHSIIAEKFSDSDKRTFTNKEFAKILNKL